MVRRVAAWVAWAAWTCNTRTRRRRPAVPVTVKRSGLRPALFFVRGSAHAQKTAFEEFGGALRATRGAHLCPRATPGAARRAGMADAGAMGRTAMARRGQSTQTPSAVPHVQGHHPGAAKSLLPRRSAFGYTSLGLAQRVVTGAERLCRGGTFGRRRRCGRPSMMILQPGCISSILSKYH
jgi:hypothetical protein